MGDWLGTGKIAPRLRVYLAFKEAREFARSLNLKSRSDWVKFCKGLMLERGVKSDEIPAYTNQTYKAKGWIGMGDLAWYWNVSPPFRKYRPFKQSKGLLTYPLPN